VARTKKRFVLGETMKAIIIAWMILVVSCLFAAQGEQPPTLGEVKQWRLHTEHGDVDIKLSSHPKGSNSHTVLSLAPNGDSIPTASEEAGLLRQVLHDMSSLQCDPTKLEMISTWLQNSEYRDGIEHAVFQSGKWKSCVGRKYCYQAEHVADLFLSSVDAFKEFDTTLLEYGLKRKTIHVDDMAVAAKGGGVLCQGLIVISLEHEK
jgi:hypothetical protein